MPYFLFVTACAVAVWFLNPLAYIFIGIAVLQGLWPQIKLILMMLGVLPGYKELEKRLDAQPVVICGVTLDDSDPWSGIRVLQALDRSGLGLEEAIELERRGLGWREVVEPERKAAAGSSPPAGRRSPQSFDLAPEDYRAIPDF